MSNSMTPERAIKSIKEHNRIHFEKEKGKNPIITEALQMAISALEYRTPKTPRCSITPFYKCPSCGNEIYENQKHCDNCGQALDWSDEE